jgi:hypothetical protein
VEELKAEKETSVIGVVKGEKGTSWTSQEVVNGE